jgi:hypothetical protein
MSNTEIYSNGLSGVLTIAAADSIAVRSLGGLVQVYQVVGYPNVPSTRSLIGTVASGVETVYGPYASGASIEIEADEGGALYNTGVGPKVGPANFLGEQASPNVLNATGSVTAAMILGGILTSTTGAAVAGTVVTGTVLDAAVTLAVGESFDLSIIATGANAFTLTANTGITIVGVAVVATVTSGLFRFRKTAADTFVAYRLS